MARNDPDRSKERAYMKEYRANNREKLLIQQKEWWDKNKEAIKARKANWRKDNPDKIALYERRHNLKSKYGWTLEDYEDTYKEQQGLCLSCKDPGPLVIDHCHITNEVRGLICSSCNLTLGHAKDSIERLQNTIKYLERFQMRTTEKIKGN